MAPVLSAIDALSEQIRLLNRRVLQLAATRYHETRLLRQVPGVGPVLSLAFVLTLERPDRFEKSRMVGPYLGLVPGRHQSGDKDPQLGITKEGDTFVRRLLVQGSQYILGPFGPDSDLLRAGLGSTGRAIRQEAGRRRGRQKARRAASSPLTLRGSL
jgi:transposase